MNTAPFVALLLAASVSSQNLIPNPGFESGMTGWKVTGNVTASIEKNVKGLGLYNDAALKLEVAKQSTGTLEHAVQIPQGVNRVGLRFYCMSVGSGSIELQKWGVSHSAGSSKLIPELVSRRGSISVTPGLLQLKWTLKGGPRDAGTFLLDDFVLQPVSGPVLFAERHNELHAWETTLPYAPLFYFVSPVPLEKHIPIQGFAGDWGLDFAGLFLVHVTASDWQRRSHLNLPEIPNIRFAAQVVEFDGRLNVRRLSNVVFHRTYKPGPIV